MYRLRGHFTAFALPFAVALAGCAALPSTPSPARQPLAHLELPTETVDGQITALLIGAEFALAARDPAKASRDYAAAARLSKDKRIAARAVALALDTRDVPLAQAMLDRWQTLGADTQELAGARAQLAMLDGDRLEAEKQFTLLLANGDAQAWKVFAGDLLTARDSALAGVVLEHLATPARLPASESVWVAIGQLAQHLGRHAFARQLADAAVERFGGVASIRWAASLRLAIGERAGAQALYAKGVAAHPDSVELRLGYAALLAANKHYAQALGVLARGPQTPATWSARVGYAAHAKNHAALQSLYTQLAHAPAAQRAANTFLLGQLAELLQRDQQALHWYGMVDADAEQGFYAQIRTAVLLDRAGRRDAAATVVHQLEQDYVGDPERVRAAYELGAQLHVQHGEHAKALAVYTRGLVALPDDPALLYDRGIVEANVGNIDAALADFRQVLQAHPDNVEVMNALGFTLADAGRDLPEATRLLSRALKAKPDVPAIMDSWGWLQYRLGDLDAARTYLDRAWSRQQDPDIGVHLGQVLWKLGQHQQARDVFAKVRKLDPHNAALRKAEQQLSP